MLKDPTRLTWAYGHVHEAAGGESLCLYETYPVLTSENGRVVFSEVSHDSAEMISKLGLEPAELMKLLQGLYLNYTIEEWGDDEEDDRSYYPPGGPCIHRLVHAINGEGVAILLETSEPHRTLRIETQKVVLSE